MCLCGVPCAVGDGRLVTGVAPAPVVNGCEQRGHRLLGGLCPQPRQKATRQKTEWESQSGNLLDSHPLLHFTFVFIRLDQYRVWAIVILH